MPESAATLSILIDIKARLDELTKAQQGIAETTEKASTLGALLKQGLGIGTGIEIASRGINFLTSSLSELAHGALQMADSIKEGSAALGISTDAYQVLDIELGKAHVDMTRFNVATQQQTVSLATARDLTSSAAGAYRALGLSVADLEAMNPDQRVIEVARAVLNATDKTRAFQAAGEILGQRGLQPLLSGLKALATDGFDKVTASAKAAGKVMSEDLVEQVAQAQTNFDAARRRLFVGTVNIAQSTMSGLGRFAGSVINTLEGLPSYDLTEELNKPKPSKTPAGAATPSPALADQQLLVQLETLKQKTDAYNSSLFTEQEKRELLLSVLGEQIKLYQKLGEVYFGKDWETQRSALLRKLDAGTITDPELKNLQTMNDLEEKLRTAKRTRMETVDTPLAQMERQLADTTTFIQQTLAGGLSSGVAGLSNDIIAASRGTQSWGTAFRNLGTTAADVLQQIIIRMLLIQAINAALGIFGYSLGGASGIVKVGTPVVQGVVKSAGGGSFVTSGPTNFTVGDNPGGVELVSVLPLSGIGRTSVNGQALRMAGGGMALVGGKAAGDTFIIDARGADSQGLARLEAMIIGLHGSIERRATSAVLDAQRRRRDGFR